MKKIGLFYGGTPDGNSARVAGLIQAAFAPAQVDIHSIAGIKPDDISRYDYLIFGTSAWGIGDMHRDWEMFITHFTDIDFSGKKIAVFGLGDQKKYPESFVDGMGTIFCRIPDKENVVGFWPVDGYNYYYSAAEKDGKFVGLAIDDDSQPELTKQRVATWCEQLKKEFFLP
ncbi:MAG TPA: flavodoxin [Bacteroidales bacterium]|nr:flavodoxin [Bacteroidales bacterium]